MKIAIIKLGALGDVIMSTPVIRALVKHHSKDELFLLTSPVYADVFAGWPSLGVESIPRKGPGASLQALTWLRKNRFHRIYDLQSNDRTRLLCALSGAREKVGNHNHFPYTHHPGDVYSGQNHIFERHIQLLASAGVQVGNREPWLPVPALAVETVQHWIRQHGLTRDRLVLMHAGGSSLHPQKRWPHFAGMAEKLSTCGYQVVWLGADADTSLNSRLAQVHGIDASNVFSIFELIALGREALLAITNDSGPMHVLACAGLPVYALFGPSDWRRNHAIGQEHRVVSLYKSNSVWHSEDYIGVDRSDLGQISADMLWSLLLKENRIRE